MFRGVYCGTPKHEDDLREVLTRAWEAGVTSMIITGGNLKESEEALELARLDDRLYCTVGCHPTRCSEFPDEERDEYFNKLLDLAMKGKEEGKVVAIGECGLDYDRLHFCTKEPQKLGFLKHFELAEKTGLPLFLHGMHGICEFFVS